MKLLVVDDSEQRTEMIKSALSKLPIAKYLEIVYCDNADSARRELTTSCDLMLLDILIPKKKNGVPQAKNSIALLSDICNPKKKYIRPRLIIGLTADVGELREYQEQFSKEATIVLRGTLNDLSWIDNFLTQIESIFGSYKKVLQNEKDRVLISVHGIRTYGQWQAKLSTEIAQCSRSFECVEIKYGFLDLLSFIVPYLRRKVIEKAAKRVRGCIKDNDDREIYIVAHSFGTLIVAYALNGIILKQRLKGIFFSGSPMQHNENIDHVVQSAEITLNECGTRDFILVLARLFILGLGDAGRVGFQRENSDNFRNRYFTGGHGLYFQQFDDYSTFYERFWVRFIAFNENAEPFDSRKNYWGEDFVDMGVKALTFVKPMFYILIPILLMLNSFTRLT